MKNHIIFNNYSLTKILNTFYSRVKHYKNVSANIDNC